MYPSLARTLSSVNAVVKTNMTGIAVVIASISNIKKRTISPVVIFLFFRIDSVTA
jgi:hypothetical protein